MKDGTPVGILPTPRSMILPDTVRQLRLLLLSLRNRAEIQNAIALPAKVNIAIRI